MKGDATSQRRWEAYDKLGTFLIFVITIVLTIQALGLEGAWPRTRTRTRLPARLPTSSSVHAAHTTSVLGPAPPARSRLRAGHWWHRWSGHWSGGQGDLREPAQRLPHHVHGGWGSMVHVPAHAPLPCPRCPAPLRACTLATPPLPCTAARVHLGPALLPRTPACRCAGAVLWCAPPQRCAAAAPPLQNPFEVGDEVTFIHSNKLIEGIVADIGWCVRASHAHAAHVLPPLPPPLVPWACNACARSQPLAALTCK